MRFVVLAAGSICNLRVLVGSLLQLDTGCKCNEVADEGIMNAHPRPVRLDDVPDYPAGMDHGILMGLLQGCERNLIVLVTSFHEQNEGMMATMINIRLAMAEGALTDDIVWLNRVFGNRPRQKSRGVGEARSEHDEEIPLRYSGVGEFLSEVKVSDISVMGALHSLISNSIRRVSMVACAESCLQKVTGAEEPSSNVSVCALCHISRSIILQEMMSKVSARTMSPGEIGNLRSLEPEEP